MRKQHRPVARARELKPDVAILGIGMPVLNGFANRQILRDNPEVKVLILTLNDSEEVVRTVLNAGARGFILKSDATRDLMGAVEALQQNRTFFTSRVNQMILAGYLGKISSPDEDSASPILTPPEREIVQLLAQGRTSKEVAWHLNLSVKTAENRRSNHSESLQSRFSIRHSPRRSYSDILSCADPVAVANSRICFGLHSWHEKCCLPNVSYSVRSPGGNNEGHELCR